MVSFNKHQLDNHTARFIESELKKFQSIQKTNASITAEQKALWRKETVAERKARVSGRVYEICDGTVRYGPFKGLKLGSQVWWSQPDHGAMILGLYEREVLDSICSLDVDYAQTFLCLGAADGYYPIGLLKTGRMQRAICFEMSELGRNAIAANAKINGVEEHIEIHGIADAQFLDAVRPFEPSKMCMLVDIEGSEFDVLTPDVLSRLRQATIIVEVHNWIDGFEDKYKRLLTSASAYFDLHKLPMRPRDLTGMIELDGMPDDNRMLLCSEGRPNPMTFLLLTPKSKTCGSAIKAFRH